MLRTNLRNQVRQTQLPKWKPILPVFEALMNSFQGIKDANRTTNNGTVTIEIERHHVLLPKERDNAPISSFQIIDNGIGLTDENFDSFNTAFSEHKLSRGGKGLGRFTWLKAFDRVEIDSVFTDPRDPAPLRRKFKFDQDYDLDERGIAAAAPGAPIRTSIRLVGFREPWRSEALWSADQIVQRLIEHFLLIFLERDCPAVILQDYGLNYSVNQIFDSDFRTTATVHDFEVKGAQFRLHGFRLTTPRVSKHKLVYAANQRGVFSDNLEDYVPNLRGRLADIEGGTRGSFVYYGIVQSPYLTEHVQPNRTDFDIGPIEDAEREPSLLDEVIGRADIRNVAIRYIHDDLAGVIKGINEAKEDKIWEYVQAEAPQYKILMRYTKEFIDKIPPYPTKTEIEIALHREVYEREVNLKAEGTRIIRDAAKVDDYDEYQRRLSDFMARYNELGVSALAQYVTHRKIILQFLERAISLKPGDKKYPLERAVHQLVFPMRRTSEDTSYDEQNLWIIDEKLTFHSFIASDKGLSSLSTFDSDSEKRPDLFIFDRKVIFAEGEQPVSSITTVEFKRPNRDDYTAEENPVTQSFDLVETIRNGTFRDTRGRKISLSNTEVPAFCYVIADITPSLRRALKTIDALSTPDNQGYYGFNKTYRVYFEVSDYDKLLIDAQKRNRIFFDKLNLVASR